MTDSIASTSAAEKNTTTSYDILLAPELEQALRAKYIIGAEGFIFEIKHHALLSWQFFEGLLEERPLFPVPLRLSHDHDEWDFVIRFTDTGLTVHLAGIS